MVGKTTCPTPYTVLASSLAGYAFCGLAYRLLLRESGACHFSSAVLVACLGWKVTTGYETHDNEHPMAKPIEIRETIAQRGVPHAAISRLYVRGPNSPPPVPSGVGEVVATIVLPARIFSRGGDTRWGELYSFLCCTVSRAAFRLKTRLLRFSTVQGGSLPLCIRIAVRGATLI